MSVTLMNMFSVPKGKKDEFVKLWEAVKVDIANQP
jgi:heme-degrading monooxygenase HmoA